MDCHAKKCECANFLRLHEIGKQHNKYKVKKRIVNLQAILNVSNSTQLKNK